MRDFISAQSLLSMKAYKNAFFFFFPLTNFQALKSCSLPPGLIGVKMQGWGVATVAHTVPCLCYLT